MSALCVGIRPLLEVLFASIFSHSVGCHFVSLLVCWAVKHRFSLIQSYHLFLLLLSLHLGSSSQKSLKVHRFSSYFFLNVICCFRSNVQMGGD